MALLEIRPDWHKTFADAGRLSTLVQSTKHVTDVEIDLPFGFQLLYKILNLNQLICIEPKINWNLVLMLSLKLDLSFQAFALQLFKALSSAIELSCRIYSLVSPLTMYMQPRACRRK